MATESILKNFVVKDKAAFDKLLRAIESSDFSKTPQYVASARRLSASDIKKLYRCGEFCDSSENKIRKGIHMDKCNMSNVLTNMRISIEKAKQKEITYKQLIDNIIGVENNPYCEDNCRKIFYFLQPFCEILENASFSENSDIDILETIKLEQQRLQKEAIKFRDQRRIYNKYLASDARFEHLLDVSKDIFSSVSIKPFKIRPIKYSPDKNVEASLLLSDLHIGATVDNQINFYDYAIARERIEELTEKTIKICAINKVKTLNIEFLGDLIDGIIQVTGRIEQEEDVIGQVGEAISILAAMIKTFLNASLNVNIYGVFGNHGRVSANKKENINHENFERLIYSSLQTMFPELKIIYSKKDDFLKIKIKDKTMLLTHGDKDRPENAVINFVRLLNEKFDEIHMGHFHSFNSFNDNDTLVVVNGSLIGVGEHAQSIRKATKPSQTLIVHGDTTALHQIELK